MPVRNHLTLLSLTRKKKGFLKVLARYCLDLILCPHLNQSTKGQTWAGEHSEGEPESPLPQTVCLSSICLLICYTARNQNCGRERLQYMSCWSQDIVRVSLSHQLRSSHFHHRQSVYPHVVYSVHQLATTQVMFTTRCSLIPRLSPCGNQALISWIGAWEWGYKVYTGRILVSLDSRQSVYLCVSVCVTPASYNTSHALSILPHTGNNGI